MEKQQFGRGKFSHYNWPNMVKYLINSNLGSVEAVAEATGIAPEEVKKWLNGETYPSDPYIRARLVRLCEPRP